MNFWNELLSGFTHEEIDILINLLTRLVMVADAKPRKKSRLLISDVPIAKPVAKLVPLTKVKVRKAS